MEPRYEGRRVGSLSAAAAMEDAWTWGRTVVPLWPFLSKWLDDHEQYDPILARSTRKVK